MKAFFLLIASTLAVISLNSPAHAQEIKTANLKAVITNIETQEGSVEIGVFNTSKYFLTKGQEFRSHSKKVNGNTMTIYFNDLPIGIYAVSFFQDINSEVNVTSTSLQDHPNLMDFQTT